LPGGAEHVLDGDRQTGERTERLATLPPGVHGASLLQDTRFINVQERSDFGIPLANRLQKPAGQNLRGDLASMKQAQEFDGGAFERVPLRFPATYSSTAGTP